VSVSAKDRRNLSIVALGAILIFLRLEFYKGDSSASVVSSSDSIPVAERRLARVRQLAATVPGKEAVLKQAETELQAREAGILKADTAAQAQAQILDTIRQAATANGIDARGADELQVRPLANDYGEVVVGENFTCGIEQLVNLLADLANRPQILATQDVNISNANDKEKHVHVRLSLSGVVARKLVPEKKGVAAPPPPFTALQAAPAVVPSGYAEIAQKTLFDKSRNPTVPVDLPPPAPPPTMPPLPAFSGIMNIGDGPIAILSEGSGDGHAVHIGESIGQFKLVGVNTEEIVLEWDGQTIRKRLTELAAAQPAPVAARAATPTRTDVPAAAPPPPPAAPPTPVRAGPGQDVGGGYRACVPNDSTPAGAVVDGYRKMVANTPFGESCTWVSAR